MAYGYGGGWAPYIPVAERRRKAARLAERLRRKGQVLAPVVIAGRAIATTLWGKAWCDNLEAYRDYASRLPRGRTYVRNGSVLDLQIAPGEVTALVNGSELYRIAVRIRPMPAAALFPRPPDIRFTCSCPDHAAMCKHVAALLYGVGARLDQQPELLFRLRAVDAAELVAGIGTGLPMAKAAPASGKVLHDDEVAALFGLDLAAPVAPTASQPPGKPRASRTSRAPAVPTSSPRAAKSGKAGITKPATKPMPTQARKGATKAGSAAAPAAPKAGPAGPRKTGEARAAASLPAAPAAAPDRPTRPRRHSAGPDQRPKSRRSGA